MGIDELGMWEMLLVFLVILVFLGVKRGGPPPGSSFWWR